MALVNMHLLSSLITKLSAKCRRKRFLFSWHLYFGVKNKFLSLLTRTGSVTVRLTCNIPTLCAEFTSISAFNIESYKTDTFLGKRSTCHHHSSLVASKKSNSAVERPATSRLMLASTFHFVLVRSPISFHNFSNVYVLCK